MSPIRGERWAEVAVPLPLRTPLTYEAPAELDPPPRPGARVLVQVGPRRMTGIVVSLGPPRVERPRGLRPILSVLDAEPILSEELLTFVQRAAEYYLYPLGEAIRAALPPGMSVTEKAGRMRKPRGDPGEELCVVRVDPLPGDPERAFGRARAQRAVLEAIPPGEAVPLRVLRRANPRARPLVNALVESGWVELVSRRRRLDPLDAPVVVPDVPPTLTADQAAALAHIVEAIDAGIYRGILLHGVTGSGKTEVYLRAIDAVLRKGRTALVLVPEIALTPQLVARFRGRLGERVAVLHSALTEAQRLREWTRLRAGDATVAIGARSAIFAPLPGLGIVVVDEEHDPSFKQDEGFRYNGRDLALLRAGRSGAVAVLGSATPSLESAFNAQTGKLQRLSLPDRVTPKPLPLVEIVDLRLHRAGPGAQTVVTKPLADALEAALDLGGQAILFLNRRGYAPVAICDGCGDPVRCTACSVSMTYHRRSRRLECHYCGFVQSLPELCPSCGAPSLQLLGVGTEKAESLLRDLLGARARVARLDSDVAPGRASEAVLDKVRSGETNVLIGTQLVTKGHDLPGVTLVGVLLADGSLNFPDFRATERTFQLLTQVAGRAGRGEIEGRVVIQTLSPNHPVVRFAAEHDYHAFYRYEMTARQELAYPPLAHMAVIRFNGPQEATVRAEAERIGSLARRLPEVDRGAVQVTGPAPAPLARLRGRFRYRLVFKSLARGPLRSALTRLIEPVDAIRGAVRAAFDIDPVHML